MADLEEPRKVTTRQRLSNAASDRFRTQGYNGTGIKQIVTDAAAPFASLYHFFPGGKQQLADETIRGSGAMFQDLVTMIWDAAPNPIQGVRDIFEGAAAVLEASDFVDACPIAVVALEVASTNETLRIATNDVFEGWVSAATARLVVEGIHGTEAHGLAIAIVALIEGGFLLSRAAKDGDHMRRCGDAAVGLVKAAIST